eukprot:1137630-Pelagomonas_calceolata.AAC.2
MVQDLPSLLSALLDSVKSTEHAVYCARTRERAAGDKKNVTLEISLLVRGPFLNARSQTWTA